MNLLLSQIAKRSELRFIIVGGGAALALLALSWGFVAAGLPPFSGTVLAYALSFSGAYVLQRNWTFRVAHGHARTLSRYLVTQVGCAIFAGVVAQALSSFLAEAPLTIAAGATIAGSGASYVLSSRWAFK